MIEVTDEMVEAFIAAGDEAKGALRERVAFILTAALSAAPDPWQAIETAKGRRVLAYAPFKDGCDGLVYITDDVSMPADDLLALPTRCMPVPSPPKEP